jgi:imidazole glycerol-phosphate synthase subunit HisH
MLAIIDYGSGNLRSVAKAFERVAPDSQIQVTQSPEVVRQASHIVLPGVGAFADCMQGLAALPGMLSALEEEVLGRKKYFLGICVGMQMLFETGYEHDTHKGLGWLKGEVVKLSPADTSLKIPHMGWNELIITQAHPLLANIGKGAEAYFVHSYHAACAHESDIAATTQYGQTISAVVARSNIMGTQFHPEKSQKAGLQLLKNFIGM